MTTAVSRESAGAAEEEQNKNTKPSKAQWKVVEAARSWGPCLCERQANGENCHSTVMVESRTWPGINKPGGVARITKRTLVEEDICGESVGLALYHVRYLLGGTEKEVRETYISCTSTGDGEARKACPRDLFTVPVSEPRSRRGKTNDANANGVADGNGHFAPSATRSSSSLSSKTTVPPPSRSKASPTKVLGETDGNRRVTPVVKNLPSKAGAPKFHDDKIKKKPTPVQVQVQVPNPATASRSHRDKTREPKPSPSSSSSSVPARGRGQGNVNGGSGMRSREVMRLPQPRAKDKPGRRNGSGALKRPREDANGYGKGDRTGTANGYSGEDSEETVKRGRSTAEGVNGAVHIYSDSDGDKEDGGTKEGQGRNGQESHVPMEPSCPPCPLEAGRMKLFSEAVYKVFEKAKADKLSLAAVKQGVRELVPAGMAEFDDEEQEAALTFLENEENKVMVCNQEVYRI